LSFAGLTLPNPVGVAAGFDKDARVPGAVLRLGCGFAEIGTVTPVPQSGNPSPRIFRLPRDHAVINRLGFNNAGHRAALERLRQRTEDGVIGINIGANKDTRDRIADYVAGLDAFYDVASYFTVNISSPNTPGLRDLQAPAALDQLLLRLKETRATRVAAGEPGRPIVVKLSPDITEEDLDGIVQCLVTHGVDGIAVSNTTLARRGLSDAAAREAGGLSGRPLFHRATVLLAKVYLATEGKIPLIGIGGIDSGTTALAKIAAGATLIQLYTGLIYEGPGLIGRIKEHLTEAVRRAGLPAITDLVGRDAKAWAGKPLDG
jgi:dihydroorotate dehydrogenase